MKVYCNHDKASLARSIVAAIRHKLPLANEQFSYEFIADNIELSNSEIIEALGPSAEWRLQRYMIDGKGICLDDKTYAATILITCVGKKPLYLVIDRLFTGSNESADEKLLGLTLIQCGLGLQCREGDYVGGSPATKEDEIQYLSFIADLSQEASSVICPDLALAGEEDDRAFDFSEFEP